MRGRWEGSHDGGQDDLGGENMGRGGGGGGGLTQSAMYNTIDV